MRNNIVIAHSLYTPNIIGGAEVSTQILAETMAKKYSVKVITVGPQNERKVSKELVNEIEVLRLHHANLYWLGDTDRSKSTLDKIRWRFNDVYNIKQYKVIKSILKEESPKILHTQNLPGLSLSIWRAAKELNIPIVHTLRDFSLLEPVPIKSYSHLYQRIARSLSRSVSKVIGISNDVLDKHLQMGYFPNAIPYIIPNVVEDKLENRDLYIKKELSHLSPLMIGYFGQLSSVKGIEYLIQAVQSLPSYIVGKLLIFGEGPEREHLEELSNEDKRIQFMGKLDRTEVSREMSRVDLTVVPSIWDEPFGRVIIESYQVGTNVLASNVGGIPEVLIEKDLNLFKPKDSNSISQAILEYYHLPLDHKVEMKCKCYEHSKKFNTSSLFLEHEKIYQNLIYVK
ncbi:glycosyltransferase involved in cell wall biosynthesis [Paenibacillus rhizosphaerae]|uniref:Glycosyltransferase involved in cell wall biosynthesis n=1 Tax=Paenibacillus rhizosphaerae TaxID=297318 RepID=A0A839TPY2_9BACL|nr:glycosyltransferase family 4 protein [Paenibacillus rhizosphaerae]MBB3129044.1 glycosyltransferase involved in cell wall biosynthesis [Paenibacillus rhizosphaerae]